MITEFKSTTTFSKEKPCRCGFTGEGDHPCHRCINKGTRPPKPGRAGLVAQLSSLSGMQMKVGAYESWGCDECWEEYQQFMLTHRITNKDKTP